MLFRSEKQREAAAQTSSSVEDYLRSLDMKLTIRYGQANAPYFDRIEQLIMRTNQFNLMTIRYTKEELSRWMERLQKGQAEIFSLESEDKYGNDGIVGLMIVGFSTTGQAVIDTFCLSCRVLGRTIENAFVAQIITVLRQKGITHVLLNSQSGFFLKPSNIDQETSS